MTYTFAAPHPTATVDSTRTRLARWPLWGVAAAISGGVATLLPSEVNHQTDGHRTTAAVIDTLQRWPYHVAALAGFVAVACLLVTATGWRRWAAEAQPGSLAAETVSRALTASAGAMMIGFGFLGSLAVYLHGGTNEHMFAREGLYAIYMVVDFGPYLAWWGVTVAAAAVAVLAFRNHAFPRWVGVVSVLAVAAAVLPLAASGLPGMPGVVGAFWLAAASVGLYRRS